MGRTHVCIGLGLMLLLLATGTWGWTEEPDAVREPVWAGRFYPADPSELRELIISYTDQARQAEIAPPDAPLRALILPHAGYIYSGPTAAHCGLVLEEASFASVILLGPDHRIGFPGGAIPLVRAFRTPLGRIPLHPEAGRLREVHPLFRPIAPARDQEHSLEVVLPFLQYHLAGFNLLPVIIGPAEISRYAAALQPLLDDRTLLVVSSDLSHFLPHHQARKRDQETIDLILDRRPDELAGSNNRACGVVPIQILLHLARELDWKPILLHASTSGDTAGTKDRVVGYAALAFFGGKTMNQTPTAEHKLSTDQGLALVKLARQTIAERLAPEKAPADDGWRARLRDPKLQRHQGTFVTLHIKGQLRGCIGSLTSEEPLVQGVRHNALNAAFQDPRFPPLSPEELDQIHIEVSVLTEPQPLDYSAPAELAERVRPHVDGLIIQKGPCRATFLPQVWEQLPRPEDFLGHLCRKAGLPPDSWRQDRLEALTYEVQSFEEPS